MSGVGRKIVGGPPRGPPQVDGPPSIRSGPSSVSGQQPPPKQFPPGLGYDPAKGPNAKPSNITNTRLDLPQEAYRRLDFDEKFESQLPKRKSYNNGPGTDVTIRVNQYKVTGFTQRDIYQYDIKIGKAEGPQAKGLIMAVWMSRAVQQQLRAISQYWLWNGDKIAWCDKAIPREELHIHVDLDAEKGRTRGPNVPPNSFLFIIKQTKVIRMATINAYLTKKIPFDNSILECINFLDHLLRHTPNENLTAIKRSYFARGVHRSPLDQCIEAMKGVYSSLRLCDISSGGRGVALNVDVANGTFWTSQDVHQAARNFCRKGNQQLHYETFRRQMLPIKASNGQYTQSEDFKSLRKMAKLKFTVKHQGKVQNEKKYTIKGFYFPKDINTSDPKYNYRQEGYHSKNVWFDWKTAPNASKAVTIYQYFQQKYNITLQHHGLPLVETEKAGKFPMEICTLLPNQQYKYKLDPDQTSAMIKFAVTRPKERLQAIQHGINMLKWSEDAYLKHYNLTIDPNMTFTKARVLKNPKITFSGTSTLDPGTTGRWDLRGKKFHKSNPEALKSWGIGVMENAVDDPTVQNFIKALIQSYVGHGGVVANKSPIISRQRISEDPGEFCKRFRQEVGENSRLQPQIMLFVLGRRDSFMYERLKKNMDCRYALFSQMLNKTHVIKAQPQYCSNVCMKINAKLGGTTGRIGTGIQYLHPGGSMIVGADVSHPSPGSPQPSMAAITVSMDAEACRFAAAVQTNGHRVEMITEANFRGMFIPLVEQWMKRVGQGTKIPSHIFYFRDGVSEAQYQHVLDQEVAHMEKALTDKYGQLAKNIKWVVTICSKRHHIRFFPKDGDRQSADRNNNALPGTLVERDVTHPFEYDFYLCAHSAIQGTARPVHYHVIRDDANVPPNGFQKMIYEMSYQYMRSTTPVSIIPAVYYAHLASNRARAHEDHAASAGPRGGQKFVEARNDAMFRGQPIPPSRDGSSQPETEAKPLLPMGDGSVPPQVVYNIRGGMWYI